MKHRVISLALGLGLCSSAASLTFVFPEPDASSEAAALGSGSLPDSNEVDQGSFLEEFGFGEAESTDGQGPTWTGTEGGSSMPAGEMGDFAEAPGDDGPVVPEPASMAALGLGVAAILARRRRR